MQKKTLPYVEDYIEILGGYLGLRGNPMQFSLARYDVQIVASLADQTNQGIGYTDRQALLAHKLVVKYKRQFSKFGIDIGFHEENGHFRIPVRMVDRSRAVNLVDGELQLKFPYDTKTIDEIRASAKNIQGQIAFNKDKRVWIMSATEPRLLWIESLANKYQFSIDESVQVLINAVKEEQSNPYEIVLERYNQGLRVRNAEQSLNDYINQELGGFGEDNYLRLVDNSSILGFRPNDEIQKEIIRDYNLNQSMLLSLRESHITLVNGNEFGDIVEYAKLTNRWPMYVFENTDVNNGKIIPILRKYFNKDELLEVNAKQRKLDVQDKKCIYLNNWQTSWTQHIPLLVTMSSLMIGPKKQHILQNSEKVVYYTNVMIKNIPTNL